MVEVSTEWKNLHKQDILPESFVEVSLAIVDKDISDVSEVSVEDKATFSNEEAIVNREANTPSERYAFLENNMWLLDGSRNILSDIDSYTAYGFVSDDCAPVEENKPLVELTISTSEVRTTPVLGFTITWSEEYGEYATRFAVTVKRGSATIGKVTLDNTSTVTQVDLPVSDYDTVIITVYGWSHPGHRVRIDKVMFGIVLLFDKGQITAYSHEQTGDVTSSEVSKNEISFSIDNSDGKWNPLNPQGIGRYLSERQEVTAKYGLDVNGSTEWISAGKFYLSEWKASQNGLEANFVARDVLGFMSNKVYSRAGVNGTVTASTTIYSEPDTDGTNMGTVKTGEVHTVSTMSKGNNAIWYKIPAGWINGNNVNLGDADKLPNLISDVLNAVSLPENFVLDIPDTIDLNSVCVPLDIRDLSTSEVIQMTANLLRCRHRVNRDGVLVFEKTSDKSTQSDYEISLDLSSAYPEIELSIPLREISVVLHPMYSNEEEVTVSETVGNSGEVLELSNQFILNTGDSTEDLILWLKKHWASRTIISGDFRADPRLDLFDVVKVESKYGVISPVMITSIKYTYNGALWGTYGGKLLLE